MKPTHQTFDLTRSPTDSREDLASSEQFPSPGPEPPSGNSPRAGHFDSHYYCGTEQSDTSAVGWLPLTRNVRRVREMSQELLDAVCQLARLAGAAIVDDKRRTSSVTLKEDESPLTSADMAAHRTIVEGLRRIDSSIPVLSEESAAVPFTERKTWTKYFLVDPLDGTKEFIKGKKEYTVNIALIENGTPTLGAVFVPELNVTYFGAKGLGSFKTEGTGALTPIFVARESTPIPRVVGSSSHASPQMETFLAALGAHELVRIGSSLKICQIADGTAHFYPRFGPTSEWDTAAGHAVVLHAGGKVLQADGSPLDYNRKDSILNPPFFVLGPEDRDYMGLAAAALDAG